MRERNALGQELASDKERDRARELYQTDDIEIDDNPAVSDAHPYDDGRWVAAWVWVADCEMADMEGM